jgi:hypothetical protein
MIGLKLLIKFVQEINQLIIVEGGVFLLELDAGSAGSQLCWLLGLVAEGVSWASQRQEWVCLSSRELWKDWKATYRVSVNQVTFLCLVIFTHRTH